jgi:hypothetical protein
LVKSEDYDLNPDICNQTIVSYAIDTSQIFLHLLTNTTIYSWSMMTRKLYSMITIYANYIKVIPYTIVLATTVNHNSFIFYRFYGTT